MGAPPRELKARGRATELWSEFVTARRTHDPRLWLSILVCVLLVAIAAVVGVIIARPSSLAAQVTPAAGSTQSPADDAYLAPSAAAIAALPVAQYNAVIPGLLSLALSLPTPAMETVYSISADTAIYGAKHKVAVARFAAENFMNDQSVIVAVKRSGPWTLVMTPARQQLPSQRVKGTPLVPAQTAGWVRTADLNPEYTTPDRIIVSIGSQTLRIVSTASDTTTATFPVGVGTVGTPTPSNVTGYLQARYVDPSQGESVYPIQLTSLHATEADNPYLGHDGGLIGLHYNTVNHGDVSHGCVRLPADALEAVDKLALGTLVTFVR